MQRKNWRKRTKRAKITKRDKKPWVIALAVMVMFVVTMSGCSNRYAPHDIELPVTDSQSAKLPELYTAGDPAKITYEQIEGITADMTYGQVVEKLGPTLDIGSGMYVLVYELEDGKKFTMSVSRWDEPIGKTGKALIETNVK